MALPKFEKDISIISKLSDQPNDTAGSALSAADLKAKFDEGGNELKEFLNTSLIPAIESDIAAAAEGVSSGGELSGERLSDGTVAGNKLAPGAVTESKLAQEAVTAEKIKNGAVTKEKIANGAVTADEIENGAVTREKIAAEAVSSEKLFPGAVLTEKIKDEAVTAAKLAPGAVTAEKIANGAVSSSYSLTIPTSEWTGTEQSFTVSGLLAEDTPIIDLGTDGLTADELLAAAEEWAKILRIAVTAADTLTVTVSEAPTADITLRMLCIRR